MPDYSYPAWMIPRESPWQALVAGVSAGAQIAANNQRGRALGAQLQHQQFQESVMQQKFDADRQDLQTLQQWWPSFANAEGESLTTLQVPPLKNAQMWNRITMEVEKKKQQAAASDFANVVSTGRLNTPEGEAAAWKASRGILPPEKVMQIITQQRTADRMEKAALARAHSSYGRIDADAAALEDQAAALDFENPEEAANLRARAKALRLTMPVHEATLPPTGPILGVEVRNPDGSVNKHLVGVPDATGKHFRVISKKEDEPITSPSVQASILKFNIADLRTKLNDIDPNGTPDERKSALDMKAKISEYQTQLNALLPGAKAKTAPTTGGLPKPTTKADFDALPAGTRFIDPEGKERIKQ